MKAGFTRARLRERLRSCVPTALSVMIMAGCATPRGQPGPTAGALVSPAVVVVESFDDITAWSAAPATGVEMRLSGDVGVSGGALRVDFDFRGGGGWAAFRREVRVRLPENYELNFWLRGDAPVNTLELKLIDESGENVWWVNRPDFAFAGDWRQLSFRRRHVTFAWGPAEGGEIRDVHAIEFAITAGAGGRGTVWIDSITVVARDPVLPYDLTPVVTASSASAAAPAVIDGDTTTAWRATTSGGQTLALDFQRSREYGGLIVHWDGAARAADYDVDVSQDGVVWRTVRSVRGGAGARDYLRLPETESRWLRLRLLRGLSPGYAVRELHVQPIEWGEAANRMFETMAADARRGLYPKYLRRVQSYWTLIGVNGANEEALMNEEGAVEVGKAKFSVEPFIHVDNRLVTWADAEVTQSLRDGYLPIPGVTWRADDLRLDVTVWADGDTSASMLWLKYTVRNEGAAQRSPTLFLALRPFQVNPSWQFLNTPGGAAHVYDIGGDEVITVDDRLVIPITRPTAFGAAALDGGGAIRSIVAGRVPAARAVSDSSGHASAALSYELTLEPGASRDVVLLVPLTPMHLPELAGGHDMVLALHPEGAGVAEQRLAAAEQRWRTELERFDIRLHAHAPPLGDMVRSNLAYVLINRDGAAIQPGSRSYERSWIRDGALTSAALLRLGHESVVREFIEWFAPFQYDNGKVPCCVDHRGADPVPEHDSHGQLIYLIAEYFRFTADTALVRAHWSNVTRAVSHIDSLRHSRMTPVYRSADSLAYYGMVPQSISHEGYAAKPMHSYWDAFFVLRGLADAAFLADVLGRSAEHARFASIRDEFRHDLHASFARAMEFHAIDYLPGSVELGDFDATSTTVGITPAGELTALEPQMRATFERYWQNFVARRDGTEAWTAYTPYELRAVGAFVRLGDRDRAHEALDWFMRDVRPPAWNHWAEVVSRDRDESRFIGDMPHGWVGSDFIRSVTDMFAYVREEDDALVVGAGILPAWLARGDSVSVRGLRTPAGIVGYAMRTAPIDDPAVTPPEATPGADVLVEILLEPGVTAPSGGLVIRSPLDRPVRTASVDGRAVPVEGDEVRLDHWPSRVLLRY
ncbi:discoidin domain-containing protein [soil metagenome]